MTMGIVVVAFLAASAGCVVAATRTSNLETDQLGRQPRELLVL